MEYVMAARNIYFLKENLQMKDKSVMWKEMMQYTCLKYLKKMLKI